MKKVLSLMLVALMSLSSFAADRAHTLKVYNWADYIDEDVLNAFPAWYKEMTGEDVEIIYQTFDINESMLTEIEVGHEDYDVICPSEYIIERMLKANLLKKIDKNIIPAEQQNFDNVAPFVVDKFQQMSETENVSDYTVGYMWGTTGFIYNPKFVDREDLRSWGAILDPKFEGRIYMKDAFRDVYSVIVLYAYREEIERGEVTRDDLVRNITPERIARVEEILTAAKANIAGWEVDFGKEEMTKGKTWMNLSWSGDAQWAIDEAAEMGIELDYVVPEEGSNVWFDGWCIPKYAVNTKAATWWINYMCLPENAIKNMDFIGYVSVIATPEVRAWVDDRQTWSKPLDLSYFFGETALAVYANPVLYADKTIIDRCALMHDAGDMNEELVKMWNRVKGDNLSPLMLGIIIVVVIAIALFIAMHFINNRKQRKLQRKRK
ncbi:MAG: ABC transporter substrate-binding protein [Paludibacteraceae bacterium]|nr:ABC transporter substrate-binding protein [Paludibacteraceae bacterium]